MSVRNLEALFEPRAVAVLGASRRPGSVGSVVMRNLREGGFEGPVLPVHPDDESVHGVLAYRDVAALPVVPDLALICTPAPTVPQLVRELGARGVRAAIVFADGGAAEREAQGRPLERALLAAAAEHGLRLLGPHSVGLLAPHVGLNASFAHTGAEPGRLAFVSQSGALCTSVLDWARTRGIGFSAFVSLGDSLDVDAADVLDYLASDPLTKAILLYLDSLREARRFLSAARAASRNKPVVAVKAGRAEAGARAAGSQAGSDAVLDYALRRAGILRVGEIDELFDAAETLTRAAHLRGERLAVVTNGAGPGVLAADELAAGGGVLAELSDETRARLDEVLPQTGARGNPIDLLGDASAQRYERAARAVVAAPEVDALLLLHSPSAVVSCEEAARGVVEAARGARCSVLASWMGGETAERGRQVLARAGVATYDTPGQAVRAFLHMVRYRRGQELLMQTPPGDPRELRPDRGRARAVLERALGEERPWLSAPEAGELLAAYGIPSVETRAARDPEEAAEAAREVGFPVALKLSSPDVSHASDVGGVVLDLEQAGAVKAAAAAIVERTRSLRPAAHIAGFLVQPMARRPGSRELLVGMACDPLFGPFLMLGQSGPIHGQGGTAVELPGERAVALPPLNLLLARELAERSCVGRLVRGDGDRLAADVGALLDVLVRAAQMVVDLPELRAFELDSLLLDASGALVLGARVRVARSEEEPHQRLAIRPYPGELEERVELASGEELSVRPIRPEDEPAHQALFSRLAQEDVQFRFFRAIQRMPHSQIARYTQIDYDREMAFIAVDERPVPAETVGVVRAVSDPDNESAEFAIVLRRDFARKGLGRLLMEKVIRYCRARATRWLVGHVLRDNVRMLTLSRRLGFEVVDDPTDPEVRVRLPLQDR